MEQPWSTASSVVCCCLIIVGVRLTCCLLCSLSLCCRCRSILPGQLRSAVFPTVSNFLAERNIGGRTRGVFEDNSEGLGRVPSKSVYMPVRSHAVFVLSCYPRCISHLGHVCRHSQSRHLQQLKARAHCISLEVLRALPTPAPTPPPPLSTTRAGGADAAGSGSADVTPALPTGDPSPPLYQLLCCSTCNRHLHLPHMICACKAT